jgi:hypothetical protein
LKQEDKPFQIVIFEKEKNLYLNVEFNIFEFEKYKNKLINMKQENTDNFKFIIHTNKGEIKNEFGIKKITQHEHKEQINKVLEYFKY